MNHPILIPPILKKQILHTPKETTMLRLAREEDLLQVEEIYHEILDLEAKTVSYTNWQKDLYPTIRHAREAYEAGTLFVGEEDGIIFASVILNNFQPEEYAKINWQTPAIPEEVIVIHTLTIRPSESGKGRGRLMVDFCEEYTRSQGAKVIRLDTYEGNQPASALYTKLGYTYVGSTKFHFQNVIWETLICFEKQV